MKDIKKRNLITKQIINAKYRTDAKKWLGLPPHPINDYHVDKLVIQVALIEDPQSEIIDFERCDLGTKYKVQKDSKGLYIKKKGTSEYLEHNERFGPVYYALQTCCQNEQCTSGLSNLKKCSQCKGRRYCSKECQVLDWTVHKNYCFFCK